MKPEIFLLLIVYVISIRGLIVVLHELGHALPAAFFTKEKVTVYIGSHGNTEKSFKLKIGLLDIWVNYLSFWKNGLCKPEAQQIPVRHQIIYTVCGPLTSITLSIIVLFLINALNLEDNNYIYSFGCLFLILSAVDFFYNIIPSSTVIHLHYGGTTLNDGSNLKRLFSYNQQQKKYGEAALQFNNKNYAEADRLFELLVAKKIIDPTIYRCLIYSNITLRKYEKAKGFAEEFEKSYELNADDYTNYGLILSKLDLYPESIVIYNKALSLNENHTTALNNKAYTFNILERYEEAILMFDKVLSIDPKFVYSYNNRGLAKIKLGQKEEGLADINKSIELDPNNSYSYRNLGIYHFDNGHYDKALPLFEQAKSLDDETHMIDSLIKETQILLDEK